MKFFPLLTIALLCLLTGCAVVVTEKTIGSNPTDLVPEEWNGTWRKDDGILLVNVTDSKMGKINIGVPGKDGNKFKLKNFEAFLTESNDYEYINFIYPQIVDEKDQETAEKMYPNHYIWFRYKKDKDTLVLWYPDCGKICDLIRQGKISGMLNKDEDVLKLNGSFEDKVIFDLEHPVILRRIIKE